MIKSPCTTCAHIKRDKNHPGCVECERRIDYLIAIEYGPQRQRNADGYALPIFLARQIGPPEPWSQADPILF
jgi:hypothetical protein